MAGSVSDEAFARVASEIGAVTFDHLEAARQVQAEELRKGSRISLADVLLQQGVITPIQRDTIEKRIQAQQTGGIKQLGPYKLLKKLGEGGMGAVYLADDTSVGRKVAVKVLPKKYSEEREFLTRFRREAQATGKLNHINIVMAYNVGEDAGTHYYAMEYCEGDTLDRILKRDKVIPWDAAVGAVLQVARGLKHAHDHGIIHRDIKPANIFVCKPLGTPEGAQVETFAEGFVAKILDLGLSKNISGDEQSFYTQTGVALGTPHYISPEQAKGEKGIDGRTDIYSLGATFYHLVTGQTPFSGTTAGVIMAKHLTDELPNPQDLNPDIPDGVAQVIAKMMAKEPADRYANCKELLDDLELVIDGKMPSSQAIDVGKSSVAVARVRSAGVSPAVRRASRPPVPSRDREGADVPLAHARGSEGRGTRQQQPVGARRGIEQPELVPLEPVPNKIPLYVGAGVAGLGLLIFIAALVFGGKPDTGKPETRSSKSKGNGKVSGQSSVVSGGKTPAVGVQPETGNLKPETAVTDAWIKMVQAQPAEKQVEEVVKKLKEMNPGWDGKEKHVRDGERVSGLYIESEALADISPLRALGELRKLSCGGPSVPGKQLRNRVSDLKPLKGLPLSDLGIGLTAVADLSPLKGMQLTALHISVTNITDLTPLKGMPLKFLTCNSLQVADLAPLRGAPLAYLDVRWSWVRDFSPLKDSPLTGLMCDFVPERDAAILRSIKTLEKINDLPVTEFWKKYPEAGTAKAAAGGERPWKPILDGKTLTGLGPQPPDALRVENGAIVKAKGFSVRSTTNHGDGEVRFRFEVAGPLNGLAFGVRQGGTGLWRVYFNRSHISGMADRINELVFTCSGDNVSGILNGKAIDVVREGNPLKQGNLHLFALDGGTLRILSIEYRELAPERLEVGQKDKDGWTCIFNGRDLTGWEMWSGKARVEDGSVVLEDAATKRALSSGDYETRGDLRLIHGGTGTVCGSILFRSPGPGKESALVFFAGGDVHLQENGAPTARAGPGKVGVGTWEHFRLTVLQGTVVLDVGGRQVLSSTTPNVRTGVLGLDARGRGLGIAFRDLWLRELGPDGKPLGTAQPDAGALPKELSLDLGGGVKMEFVLVPAGEFDMGSNNGNANEKPVHRVKISKPFYMGKYEVTQAQYGRVMDKNRSSFKGAELPVETVTWEDAQEFCRVAGKVTNCAVKLPTEAQWEYACRAGTARDFNLGQGEQAVAKAAWYYDNAGKKTHTVGQKVPNPWGLYDMHGNVSEWCADYFDGKYYAESPPADPPGPPTGKARVARGGGWGEGAGCQRSAFRGAYAVNDYRYDTGFRVVMDAPKAP